MAEFSIEEFLDKIQSILLSKFREKFNDKFSIANTVTTIEPNFADSIMTSFSKDFLELPKLLDPNLNREILEVSFKDTDLDKLISIVSRARLAKLRGDLDNKLDKQNNKEKKSKV